MPVAFVSFTCIYFLGLVQVVGFERSFFDMHWGATSPPSFDWGWLRWVCFSVGLVLDSSCLTFCPYVYIPFMVSFGFGCFGAISFSFGWF